MIWGIWDTPYNLNKIFKKAVNLFSVFSRLYSYICFSLIPIVDKGKMHYDAYSLFMLFFLPILRILNAMTANLDS